MHRAVGRAAVRAGEAAAPGEVDLDIEPTLLGIEGAGLHHPRRDQPERQLHQIGVAHRGVSRRPVEPRSCRRARARQGVAWRRRARVELSVPAILDGRCARAPSRNGRSGRRDGSSIEQRDGTKDRHQAAPVTSTHSEQRGGKKRRSSRKSRSAWVCIVMRDQCRLHYRRQWPPHFNAGGHPSGRHARESPRRRSSRRP